MLLTAFLAFYFFSIFISWLLSRAKLLPRSLYKPYLAFYTENYLVIREIRSWTCFGKIAAFFFVAFHCKLFVVQNGVGVVSVAQLLSDNGLSIHPGFIRGLMAFVLIYAPFRITVFIFEFTYCGWKVAAINAYQLKIFNFLMNLAWFAVIGWIVFDFDSVVIILEQSSGYTLALSLGNVKIFSPDMVLGSLSQKSTLFQGDLGLLNYIFDDYEETLTPKSFIADLRSLQSIYPWYHR